MGVQFGQPQVGYAHGLVNLELEALRTALRTPSTIAIRISHWSSTHQWHISHTNCRVKGLFTPPKQYYLKTFHH